MGHERENWNRQLHHFAQRIFKVAAKQEIGQASPTSIATLAPNREGRTATRYLVRIDGRTVMHRPAPLLVGPTIQP